MINRNLLCFGPTGPEASWGHVPKVGTASAYFLYDLEDLYCFCIFAMPLCHYIGTSFNAEGRLDMSRFSISQADTGYCQCNQIMAEYLHQLYLVLTLGQIFFLHSVQLI